MVTMKDIAKKTGLSIATVSAVVNQVPIVSPRAKQQILKAIEELGYHPNAVARSLKNSRTSSLAMIVRDITNPFYPSIILGFEEMAWSNGYEVFLCNTENDHDRERTHIDKLIEKRVDGVVISTALYDRSPSYDRLSEQGIPYVFLNRSPETLLDGEDFVGTDNSLGSRKVVAHLANLGYSDIAYMSGPINLSTFKGRYEGFLSGVEENNLTINKERIFFEDYSEEAGYHNAKNLISSGKLPHVIYCSSDMLAFGVYKAMKEAGIRIPEDIALIGFDNNRYGHLIELTSVDAQNKEMGRIACGKLIHALENKEVGIEERKILLEPHIVIRNTCGSHL